MIGCHDQEGRLCSRTAFNCGAKPRQYAVSELKIVKVGARAGLHDRVSAKSSIPDWGKVRNGEVQEDEPSAGVRDRPFACRGETLQASDLCSPVAYYNKCEHLPDERTPNAHWPIKYATPRERQRRAELEQRGK